MPILYNIIVTYPNTSPLIVAAATAAKSLQSCPTLCDPRDSSSPGFPVPGILQARTLEWVAISFSNAWKWKVKVKSLSRSQLLATPWTAAYQALLSMDFPGKSTGVGCHCLLRPLIVQLVNTYAFYNFNIHFVLLSKSFSCKNHLCFQEEQNNAVFSVLGNLTIRSLTYHKQKKH